MPVVEGFGVSSELIEDLVRASKVNVEQLGDLLW
jgi:hypothetical protein